MNTSITKLIEWTSPNFMKVLSFYDTPHGLVWFQTELIHLH